MRQNVMIWCGEHADQQLELLKQLAAIPAPSHQEHRRVEWISAWLKDRGFPQVIVDEALNVIVPFDVPEWGPYTVFMAHTDVVFPDLTPLPVKEENGRLYAPGVGDDTANVASLMICAEYLLTHSDEIKSPILIVFNSCEEGLGNLKGVRQICKDYEGKIKELISFDGTYEGIVSKAVGSERWKVTCSTCGGHSYGAFGNPNAIAHLADLVVLLYSQPIPPVPETKTTYNVGTISGGTSVNTIAQDAEMLYEYRSDDKECLETMRKQFEQALEVLNGEDAVFRKELMGERPCMGDVDPQKMEELLERCAVVMEDFSGNRPLRRPSSTDANIPLSLGIPATCFGMYQGSGAHTREEYLEIDSLLTGLKIGLTIITEFCC